jgi:beta-lactamase regulating signal transducer with metallopeptidase domain
MTQTQNLRLEASIERLGAKRIATLFPITAQTMEDAVACTHEGGVILNADFVETAEDAVLDNVIAHEITHLAMTPQGLRIAGLVMDMNHWVSKIPQIDGGAPGTPAQG